MTYSEFKPTKMERGKTYKTLRDNKLWFCVGHIKHTPVCANWEGENFVQDFKCTWFKIHRGQTAKPLLPKMDPDKGCKHFSPR